MGRPKKRLQKEEFESIVMQRIPASMVASTLGVAENTLSAWIAMTYGLDPVTQKPYTYSSICPVIEQRFVRGLWQMGMQQCVKSPDLYWKFMKNFTWVSDNPTPMQSDAKPSAFLESLNRLSKSDDEDIEGFDIPSHAKEKNDER